MCRLPSVILKQKPRFIIAPSALLFKLKYLRTLFIFIARENGANFRWESYIFVFIFSSGLRIQIFGFIFLIALAFQILGSIFFIAVGIYEIA